MNRTLPPLPAQRCVGALTMILFTVALAALGGAVPPALAGAQVGTPATAQQTDVSIAKAMAAVLRPAILALGDTSAAPGTFYGTGPAVAARADTVVAPIGSQQVAGDGIPILAWHDLLDQPRKGDPGLTDTFGRFEETLRFLHDKGFRSVFPEEVRLQGQGGGRQVILTFDDGHRSALSAAELMEGYGFRGIFFVIPARIHDQDAERWLLADDLRRLAERGHRIAAHGYRHRSMPASGEEVAASLRSSLAVLDSTGSMPSALDFAFPFGHYAPFVAAALGDAFAYLHTVNPGYWDGESPMLPRILIAGDVDLDFYTEYLLGGESFSPSLEVLAADGAVTDTVLFRLPAGTPLAGIELLAVSADADGRFYASHPIHSAATLAGDTLVLDLRAHMERYYSPDRTAISYALVRRDESAVEYLTAGLLHWIADPASGPRHRGPYGSEQPAVRAPAENQVVGDEGSDHGEGDPLAERKRGAGLRR